MLFLTYFSISNNDRFNISEYLDGDKENEIEHNINLSKSNTEVEKKDTSDTVTNNIALLIGNQEIISNNWDVVHENNCENIHQICSFSIRPITCVQNQTGYSCSTSIRS